MPQPFVIDIPHKIGKNEARRRLETGLTKATDQFSSVLTIDEEIWSGDRLTFQITALKQKANGWLEVLDDRVHLEIVLPWLLAGLAHGVQAVIRERGQRLLERK